MSLPVAAAGLLTDLESLTRQISTAVVQDSATFGALLEQRATVISALHDGITSWEPLSQEQRLELYYRMERALIEGKLQIQRLLQFRKEAVGEWNQLNRLDHALQEPSQPGVSHIDCVG
jgi:hypothetical protein